MYRVTRTITNNAIPIILRKMIETKSLSRVCICLRLTWRSPARAALTRVRVKHRVGRGAEYGHANHDPYPLWPEATNHPLCGSQASLRLDARFPHQAAGDVRFLPEKFAERLGRTRHDVEAAARELILH